MPRYLIERTIPGLGQMTGEDLHAISEKSNHVLTDMQRHGTPIQWDHSYVTENVLHCVYVAPNAEAIREHARCGGFPADNILRVSGMIDPTTGE